MAPLSERARELKDNGLFGVWVSFDHYEPDVHNKMRGHPKAFQNACRAVQYFKEAGVYTCLSLVPPKEFESFDHFERYYDMAKRLGVAEIRVMETKPSGREACRGVKSHSAALAQLQEICTGTRNSGSIRLLVGYPPGLSRIRLLGVNAGSSIFSSLRRARSSRVRPRKYLSEISNKKISLKSTKGCAPLFRARQRGAYQWSCLMR